MFRAGNFIFLNGSKWNLVHSPKKANVTVIFLLGFLTFSCQSLYAQTVAFNSSPLASGDTIKICAGQSITYTDASLGVISGQTYNWNFGGGTPASATAVGPHTVLYSSFGTFSTTLTIGSNTSTKIVLVESGVTGNILGLSAGGAYNFSGNNFRYCGSNFGGNVPFTFQINNANFPANSTLSINWGDSQSQTVTLPATSVFHLYNGSTTNVHTLTATLTTPVGCVFVQTYQVYQGSSPTIGVTSGTGQDVCIPFDYNFTLISNNVPGTTYTVGFTDLTAPVVLTVPFNSAITHTFNLSSCGFTASSSATATYLNAFQCGITANNSCGSTSTTIAPIYVSSPPIVSTSVAPSNVICQFDTLSIANTTVSTISNSVLGCDTTTYYFWDIQPPVGFNILNNGVLGDSGTFGLGYFQGWTQGSSTLNLEFVNSGVYEVALVVANACSIDSTFQTITVNPTPVIQDYQETICSGDSFNYSPINNLPMQAVPAGTTYNWTVSSNPNILGGSSGSGSIISNTLVNLTNVADSLVYSVIPFVNGCYGDTFEVTIIVLPGLSLPDFTETICNGTSFSFSPLNNPPATIIPAGTNYTWTAGNNATISGASNGAGLIIADTLTSSVLGNQQSITYQVIAQTNSGCGTDTFDLTVHINSIAVSNIDSNQTICSGGDPAPILFATPPASSGNLTYQWQSAASLTANFANLTGETMSFYNPPSGLVSTSFYQVVLSSNLNGTTCSSTSNVVEVFVNPNPLSDAGNDTLLTCFNLATGVEIGSSPLVGHSYSWLPTQGLSNPTISNPIATSGNEYVLLTTNTSTGCFSKDTVLVALNNQPPVANAGNDTTINCLNYLNGVQIGMPASGNVSYSWTPNSNLSSAVSSNPNATPGITTQYILTVFDLVNGCSSLDSVMIFVDTVKPTANAGPDATILCSSDTTGVSIGSLAMPGMNYAWNPGGTLSSALISNPIATPPTTTNYILTVTNPLNGCTDSDTVLVSVSIDLTIVHAGPDQYVCSGSAVTLAGSGATTYAWNNGVIDQIPFIPTVTTSYILTGIDSTGGCQNTDTVVVFVNPIPVANDPADQVVCNNTSTSDVIFSSNTAGTTYEWVNSNPAIGLPATGNGNILTFIAVNTTNSPISAVITVTPIYENGGVSCAGDTVSFTIIVNPTPTVDATIDQVICSGNSSSMVQFSSSFGAIGTDFSWVNNNTNTGLSATTGLGNIASFTGLNSGTGVLTSEIIVTPILTHLGTTCYGFADTFLISINPLPIVMDPSNQIVCNNNNTATVNFSSSVIGTSFNWVNSNTAIGLAANGSGDILSFTGTNLTNTAITSIITVTPIFQNAGVSCAGDTTTFTYTINPTLIVSADSSATYCQYASLINSITASSNGNVNSNYYYQWYSNSTNTFIGASAILNANSSSYIPPVNGLGTNFYFCTISQDLAVSNCTFSSNSVAISVNLAPTFTIQPIPSQTVCLDGTLNPLEVAYQNGIGVPTYQWYSNMVNSTFGGSPIVGATSAIYTPPTSSIGTTYYYCIATFALGGCGEIISNIGAVLVQPDPSIVVQPISNQSICVGGTIGTPLTITYTGGVGIPSYQWQQGGVAIFGATGSTFTPGAFALPGTYDYTVILTLNGNGCDADTSQSANIQVVPDPVVSSQPLSATYCQNATLVSPLTVDVSGGIGIYNYQWYSNTTNSNSSGTLINGATDSIYTPSVNSLGTVYYYCIITQSGLNCAVISLAAGVTITAPPVFTAQPLSTQSLCIGGTPSNLSVAYSGGNTTVLYQWFENAVNSNVGGTPILGANTNSYSPASNSAGTLFYYCVLTFQTGGCSSITSNTAEVIVVNDLAINSQTGLSQSICQGTTTNTPLVFNYSGGTGTNTISWYQVGSPNTLINGATGTSYQPAVFNTPGTFEFIAIVSASGAGCDNAQTNPIEVIVNPTPHVNFINDTAICNSGILSVNLSSNIPSTFVWNAIDNLNITGESTNPQISTSITDSLVNNSATPQFVTYQVTPTSTIYNCVGPDSTFVVQVQPDILLSMPTNIEICSGNSVNAVLSANAPSNFDWFVSVNNSNVTGESLFPVSSNLITDILVNTSSVNQMVIYSVHPTSILGTCNGSFQTFVVTVKPPLVLLNEDTVTICSGENMNLSLIANTNVTFNWYADQNPNVLNESTLVTSSPTINDALVNTTNTVQQVLYHVVGTSSGNGCSSSIFPIVVYVNPVPAINPIADTIVCNGINFAPILISGPVNNTVYQWVASNNSIGIPQLNGINSLPGFVTSNNISSIEQTIITVTPIYTSNNLSCTGTNEVFGISVLPTPAVNPLPDLTFCNGSQVSQNSLSGPVSNTVYNWSNSNTSILLGASGVDIIPAFTAQNTTNVDQISAITILPSIQLGNTQCFGSNEDYTITVHPSAHVMNTGLEICSGENTNLSLVSNIPCSFEWYASPTLSVFNETSFPIQTSTLIDDTLTILANSPQVVNYHITTTSIPFGCVGVDTVLTITVNPLPIVNFSFLNPALCDLQTVNFQNNSQGILNYDWDFGNGSTSFLINPTTIYSTTGTYTIQLTATNPFTGCTNFFDSAVVISESPDANFTYSDSAGCGAFDVVFTANVLNPSWSYSWDFGNGETSQQWGSSGSQFLAIGCYDIALTVGTDEGCLSTINENNAICVYHNPIAAFSVDNATFSSLVVPVVQFTNQSQFSTGYYWQFGDNTTSITENPLHEYFLGQDEYLVTLTASNNEGCTDTAKLVISIIEDVAIYIPNSFTPNEDEYNQYFLPILSSGFKKSTFHMIIFDRWGEIVFESFDENIGWDGSYGVGDHLKKCPSGNYNYKVTVDVLATGETKKYMGHVNLIR